MRCLSTSCGASWTPPGCRLSSRRIWNWPSRRLPRRFRGVLRGATTVVVFPYFLLPGRHWNDDIPRLAAAAAKNHPGVRYLVTAPFGLHPLMAEVMRQRIDHCLAHTRGEADACELCAGTERCQLREGSH